MANEAFYEAIFPNFWNLLNRSVLIQDEHSMFGDQEIFDKLIEAVRPNEIVEVGSWKGHSANYMIDLCKKLGLDSRIVCVDTFLGGPEHWVLPGAIDTLHRENGRPTILERFLGNTIGFGNSKRVFPLTVDSYAASEILRIHDFKADLVFLDGAHDPDSVRNDIMRYYPRLSERGVMFGDDYQHEPLARTVHECAEKLGVKVAVAARKWIFADAPLAQRLELPGMAMRTSFEGWVHP